MKLLLLLVLSFISATLYSQDFRKGFIVTPQNDTVRGFVSFREGLRAHSVCSFKASQKQDVVKYEPTQLMGYGFENNTRFVSKMAEVRDGVQEQAFLEVLVTGRVTLYKYDYFYFLEKDDGKLRRVIIKEVERERNGTTYIGRSTLHIGLIKVMLNDCEALQPTIESSLERVELTERALAQLVTRYNACVGAPTVAYKERKPWFKAEIGILAGVTQSALKIKSDYAWNAFITGSYRKSTAPMGGISFLLSSPRLNERVAFLGEAQYLKSSYYLYNQSGGPGYTQRNYISITLSQLRIPVAVRYTFTGQKISPFLDIGFLTTVYADSKGSVKTEMQYPQNVIITAPTPLRLRNHQTGVWGGVGLIFPVHPRWNGFAEFRYERTNGLLEGDLNTVDGLSSSITNLQLIIGLRTK